MSRHPSFSVEVRPMRPMRSSDERGIALIMVLLLALVVTSLAIGGIMLSQNSSLITRFHAKEAAMVSAADAGLEWARDTLNSGDNNINVLMQQPTGFDTLQLNAPVKDASGQTIPGFTRSVYAGRSGITSDEFGVYASIISVISDPRGAVVVRRSELAQESFSVFGEFYNTWSGGIMYGCGESSSGRVHSNQGLNLQSGCAGGITFRRLVTTVNTISNRGSGAFAEGFQERARAITFPPARDSLRMLTYANMGGTRFTGDAPGVMNPNTRIEFVSVDLNGDGDSTDENEGFFRIYRGSNTTQATRDYVSARRINGGGAGSNNVNVGSVSSGVAATDNCGDYDSGLFLSAQGHDTLSTASNGATHAHGQAGATNAKKQARRVQSLLQGTSRCYLGGDPRLFNGFQANDAYGQWLPSNNAAATAALTTALTPSGRAAEAPYLFPLSRSFNPDFKGVIYITGSIAVSGQVRGRATLYATGNILIADDVTYNTAPNTDPACPDILGLYTVGDVELEDNSINTPFKPANAYRVFDPAGVTTGLNVHAIILALGQYEGENYGQGAGSGDRVMTCNGVWFGRGCIRLIGAKIVQAVGATYSGGDQGWQEQNAYDACAYNRPPPYYPTTGRYFKHRYYEIDPVGFDIAGWFAANQH